MSIFLNIEFIHENHLVVGLSLCCVVPTQEKKITNSPKPTVSILENGYGKNIQFQCCPISLKCSRTIHFKFELDTNEALAY